MYCSSLMEVTHLLPFRLHPLHRPCVRTVKAPNIFKAQASKFHSTVNFG